MPKRLALRSVPALVLATALSASLLHAQSFRGGIRGAVSDTSGAAVPGASVTATSVATGLARTALTDAQGNYVLSELPLGDWNVTASLSGFSAQTVKGVRVDASATRRVDLVLGAGGRQESVEVVAGSPLVDSTGDTMGGTISGAQAAEIPLNGRDFTKLLSMVPGTAADPSSINDSPGSFGLFSANGNRGPLEQLPARRHGHERRLPQPAGDQPGRRVRHALHGAARRRGRGVPDPLGRRGRVRAQLGRDRQHRDALGHQHAPRRRLRVLPQRRPRRAQLLQRAAAAEERLQEPPVRRLARRPAREGPDVLLLGLRGPARGRRHTGPLPRPDRRRDRRLHRGERRRREPGDRGPARAPPLAVPQPGARRQRLQPPGHDAVLERPRQRARQARPPLRRQRPRRRCATSTARASRASRSRSARAACCRASTRSRRRECTCCRARSPTSSRPSCSWSCAAASTSSRRTSSPRTARSTRTRSASRRPATRRTSGCRRSRSPTTRRSAATTTCRAAAPTATGRPSRTSRTTRADTT